MTSALIQCGFAGHREGYFLPIVQEVLNAASSYFDNTVNIRRRGNTLHDVDEAEFSLAFADFMKSYMDKFYGSMTWVEKSGERSLNLSCLYQQVFPNSRFIFTKRRPIETIISRCKKFPDHGFRYHCRNLRTIMTTWAEMRDALQDKIEIDQYDIAMFPQREALNLSRFLQLDQKQQSTMTDQFTNSRPQRTSESYKPPRFEDLPWPARDKEFFRKQLHGVMSSYGYSYDDSYYVHSC